MTKQFIENAMNVSSNIFNEIWTNCFNNGTMTMDILNDLECVTFEDILNIRALYKEQGNKRTTITINFNSIDDSVLSVEVYHWVNGKRTFKFLLEESYIPNILAKVQLAINILK